MNENSSYENFTRAILKTLEEKKAQEYRANPQKYSCPICNDKGIVYLQSEEGDIVSRYCSCYRSKVAARLGKDSGFGVLLDLYSFENFSTPEKFQVQMLEKAKEFCADEKAHWFFLGGQSGAGKTHLCTAVAKHYIEAGFNTQYFCWPDFANEVKKLFGNPDRYYQLLDRAKNTQVLFLDDLFKGATARDTQPTEADIKLAFEILNRRYIDGNKVTIISSEWTLADLLHFDEGTFSRVHQACGKYKIDISRDAKRNYRFKPQ